VDYVLQNIYIGKQLQYKNNLPLIFPYFIIAEFYIDCPKPLDTYWYSRFYRRNIFEVEIIYTYRRTVIDHQIKMFIIVYANKLYTVSQIIILCVNEFQMHLKCSLHT